MSDKIIENNQVSIRGEVVSEFLFSHEVFCEGFYLVEIITKRFSEILDKIPVLVSERLIDVTQDCRGEVVCVTGQMRSYNKHEADRNHLILSVFAREFEIVDAEEDLNQIFLDGYICRTPMYRKTPMEREITDFILTVNRPYGKSDYIPCICWGRNAKFSANLNAGDHVRLQGRIQSREYKKKLSDDEFEYRLAYEISVSKMEVM